MGHVFIKHSYLSMTLISPFYFSVIHWLRRYEKVRYIVVHYFPTIASHERHVMDDRQRSLLALIGILKCLYCCVLRTEDGFNAPRAELKFWGSEIVCERSLRTRSCACNS